MNRKETLYVKNQFLILFSLCSSENLLALASCYIAFGYSYIENPSCWTFKTINDILLRAKHLLNLSMNQISNKKLRHKLLQETFYIHGYKVEVKCTGPEIIGNIIAAKPQATNIFKGLRLFFRKSRRSCLFRCDPILLLIWKANGHFYIFDSNGRTEQCITNSEIGYASLICVETLMNVACLIVQMSGLNANEFFVLSELRMKQLTIVKSEKEIPTSSTEGDETTDRSSFIVLSEHSAILQGSLTISNDFFKTSRNHQSLAVCCIANIYNHIHPPNSWTNKIIDKVVLLGNQLYEQCTKYDLPEEFTIDHIPREIIIGPYKATIRISPYQRGGQLQHSSDFRLTDLMLEMEQCFNDYSDALLQVTHFIFAIWKRDGVYYLFDPYARGKSGEVMHVRGANGAACLHMHSTLHSMCSILYANLMKIAEKEVFYLHGLLTCIAKNDSSANLTTSSGKSIESDIKPLNESVEDFYLPSIDCKGSQRGNISVEYNLDSPAVSDTQFIRPWHILKQDLYGDESQEEEIAKISGKSKKK